MTVQYSVGLRNAELEAIAAELVASSSAIFKIYDGSVPASAAVAIGAQNVLWNDSSSWNDWDFNAASGGSISADLAAMGDSAEPALLSGTATFFRILTPGNQVMVQGTVGVSGSGADLIIGSTSIIAGYTYRFSSIVFNNNQV